uniref:Uncharacterized protein n=1 Tax=Triticum urartu TaxID=4572 RepID=A0A8R7K191_TRIUA
LLELQQPVTPSVDFWEYSLMWIRIIYREKQPHMIDKQNCDGTQSIEFVATTEWVEATFTLST